MSEKTYNDEALRAYLLGSLPAEEAERFDELSVTDGKFFEELTAVEHDLVDAYVNLELDVADRDRFETYFLATPRRRDKLKFAENLDRIAEGRGAVTTVAEVKSSEAGFFSFLKDLLSPRLAFAAFALICLALGGWLILRDRRSDYAEVTGQNTDETRTALNDQVAVETPRVAETPGVSEVPEPQTTPTNSVNRQINTNEKERSVRPEPRSVVAVVLPAPLRGASMKTVTVPESASRVSVSLELESDESDLFYVVLRDRSARSEPWKSGAVKPSGGPDRKVLNLNIPANLLKPGVYSLNVAGVSADGTREIIGDYLFRVVR